MKPNHYCHVHIIAVTLYCGVVSCHGATKMREKIWHKQAGVEKAGKVIYDVCL